MESCLSSSFESKMCPYGIVNNFYQPLGFLFVSKYFRTDFSIDANHSTTRLFGAHNSLIKSDFWMHNSLNKSYFERWIVWTMVWFRSNQRFFPSGKVWSEKTLAWPESTRCFQQTSVWSVDTLVCDDLIRGHFRMAPQPGQSKTKSIHTWVEFEL